jgi:hypothetical protein
MEERGKKIGVEETEGEILRVLFFLMRYKTF